MTYYMIYHIYYCTERKGQYLGEVKLERVIGRERDAQASAEVLWKRVPVVVEEKRVVAQW